MAEPVSSAPSQKSGDLIAEALNNGANHINELCKSFGVATTQCTVPNIMGAIINARQAAFKETMNDICNDIRGGTPKNLALEAAGLDTQTNLQCDAPASSPPATNPPPLQKVQKAGPQM